MSRLILTLVDTFGMVHSVGAAVEYLEVHVSAGRVGPAGWIKPYAKDFTGMLQYWTKYWTGLKGVTFDYRFDMHNITDGAPIKLGDGIHSKPIVYRAVLDELLYKFMHPDYTME